VYLRYSARFTNLLATCSVRKAFFRVSLHKASFICKTDKKRSPSTQIILNKGESDTSSADHHKISTETSSPEPIN
jgi:hypothetical protein